MSINSLLSTGLRPTVRFDATNRDHRRHAHQFLKDRSWKNCPYVFTLHNSEDNVYAMITKALSEYYTDQEFGQVSQPAANCLVLHSNGSQLL